MIKKYFPLIAVTFFTLNAQADINIITEGDRSYVDREACTAAGGKIDSKTDKRYVMCRDGKYDGFIAGTNEDVCNVQIGKTRELQDAQGLVNDEVEFLAAASSALGACTREAHNFSSELETLSKTARKVC